MENKDDFYYKADDNIQLQVPKEQSLYIKAKKIIVIEDSSNIELDISDMICHFKSIIIDGMEFIRKDKIKWQD